MATIAGRAVSAGELLLAMFVQRQSPGVDVWLLSCVCASEAHLYNPTSGLVLCQSGIAKGFPGDLNTRLGSVLFDV